MLDYKFLEAWNELNNLTEAQKETCLISVRTPEKFRKVEATILSSEFFAYKDNYSKWVVVDKASGCAIKSKLETLAAAKEYLKNLPEDIKEKIIKIKTLQSYKDKCAELAAANIDK